MSSEHERRQFRRYPLRLRARLRHGLEEVEAEVLNASVGGCLLMAHLRVEAGALLEVSIPDLQVPPTSMAVVRCTPTDSGFMIATCFESPVADEPALVRQVSEGAGLHPKSVLPN
ncbi:PilZ domain-containing protein [Archangium lansingense]|uniref:PilZ domain-containing protein n=1 Tax=Archangium lansingense TaxID=2995310 RepID=A0ABT4AQG3_9BACT|nr:PilZ domain-containing protein [Archangium lansinium]MCY1083511.1 PilZ domain-containing protein [Archangium lansinium]